MAGNCSEEFVIRFTTSAKEDGGPVRHWHGLLGYWDLDKGFGDVAPDQSGNDHNGRLINDAVWVDGKFGHAVELREDGKIVVPHADSLNTPDSLTLMFWLLPDSLKGSIISKTGAYQVSFMNGQIVWIQQGQPMLRTPQLKKLEWTHVAFTFDGNTLKAYLNGELVSTRDLPLPLPVSDNDLVMGGDGFRGILDEISLWDQALTHQEISKTLNGLLSLWSVNRYGKIPIIWGDAKSWKR